MYKYHRITARSKNNFAFDAARFINRRACEAGTASAFNQRELDQYVSEFEEKIQSYAPYIAENLYVEVEEIRDVDNFIDVICDNIDNFQVFEDGGGGLYLAIWDGGKFYCHDGYEYTKGQLLDNLIDLYNCQFDSDWENMQDMTEEEYMDMINEPYSGKIIMDRDGLYPGNMGGAGGAELGDLIETNE